MSKKKKEDGPKVLTEADMRSMEQIDAAKNQVKLQTQLLEKELQISRLQVQLRVKEMEDQVRGIEASKKKILGRVKSYENVIESLRAKYTLGKKWGYDPESGEIKE